jgi:uncharacterized protein
MKYLLLILVVGVVVWWLRRSIDGRRDAPATRRDPPGPDGAGRASAAEPMLRCAHCGVHLPGSESVSGPDGRVFCSRDHLIAHEAGRDPH